MCASLGLNFRREHIVIEFVQVTMMDISTLQFCRLLLVSWFRIFERNLFHSTWFLGLNLKDDLALQVSQIFSLNIMFLLSIEGKVLERCENHSRTFEYSFDPVW